METTERGDLLGVGDKRDGDSQENPEASGLGAGIERTAWCYTRTGQADGASTSWESGERAWRTGRREENKVSDARVQHDTSP